ncbi:MAG: PEP-CTERM-box response regulator transcription factor [Syntrophobacteraceae bacterium]
MAKLLIVEDDEGLRTQMKWALASDYEVLIAENREEALAVFVAEHPPVVTLDLGLPPDPLGVSEGLRTLSDLALQDTLANVIVITGRGEKEHALKAVDLGAYDFFCKPVDIDELKVILRRAAYLHQLELENRRLRSGFQDNAFEGMLGVSPQMQGVFSAISKVATTDASVLVEGESGTGKELAARAIHNLSPRKNAPFVAINCAAIPENLLESELFGHEKGAFTGAHALKKGHIELANGGTLFLDEVGDLPHGLQAKLLRFLQDQKLMRVGGRKEIQIDVRVLAATNVDLKAAIKEGRFREDLYYRFGVVVISLPPLRDREGDVGFLAQSILNKYTLETKKKSASFSPQAMRLIESHNWPGNIRELDNRIKRAVIMADGPSITPGDMQLDSEYSKYSSMNLREAREALEKELIQRALAKHKGNVTQASAELGVSRPTLYELMDKLGIQR